MHFSFLYYSGALFASFLVVDARWAEGTLITSNVSNILIDFILIMQSVIDQLSDWTFVNYSVSNVNNVVVFIINYNYNLFFVNVITYFFEITSCFVILVSSYIVHLNSHVLV